MLVYHFSYLYFFIFSRAILAVDGYSQIIIVHNKTNTPLSLFCRGGARITRESDILVAPGRAHAFLSDVLVEPFDNLLGGNYRCRISIGAIQDHQFSLSLANGQNIAIWTLDEGFEQHRQFRCGSEFYGNFIVPERLLIT
jgi:hypothetical protein